MHGVLAVAGALATATLFGLWWALRRRRGDLGAPSVPERASGRL